MRMITRRTFLPSLLSVFGLHLLKPRRLHALTKPLLLEKGTVDIAVNSDTRYWSYKLYSDKLLMWLSDKPQDVYTFPGRFVRPPSTNYLQEETDT